MLLGKKKSTKFSMKIYEVRIKLNLSNILVIEQLPPHTHYPQPFYLITKAIFISLTCFITFIIQRPSQTVNTGGQYGRLIFFSYFPVEYPSITTRKSRFSKYDIRVEFL